MVSLIHQTGLSGARPRILIVDDEPVIADSLALIFQREGYEAVAVYNGVSAIEAASGFAPDVLLCDVSMPGMNGIEAASFVRAAVPSCHVLLFSAHANLRSLREEIWAQECPFELIAKPIHPHELLSKVGEVLLTASGSCVARSLQWS